jgi:hypothetical protein
VFFVPDGWGRFDPVMWSVGFPADQVDPDVLASASLRENVC